MLFLNTEHFRGGIILKMGNFSKKQGILSEKRKENSDKLDSVTRNSIIQLGAWTPKGADLKVISPGDENFSVYLVEELSSLDLVFTQLASYKTAAIKPLLEEMIMVFQDIILRGVNLDG